MYVEGCSGVQNSFFKATNMIVHEMQQNKKEKKKGGIALCKIAMHYSLTYVMYVHVCVISRDRYDDGVSFLGRRLFIVFVYLFIVCQGEGKKAMDEIRGVFDCLPPPPPSCLPF
jgi:hypothetical protein